MCPVDQALLDLHDVDRADILSRNPSDGVAQTQATDKHAFRSTARDCEFTQQTLGGGFAAIHGEDAIDDQLFSTGPFADPPPQDDLASRPSVPGDGLNRLHLIAPLAEARCINGSLRSLRCSLEAAVF